MAITNHEFREQSITATEDLILMMGSITERNSTSKLFDEYWDKLTVDEIMGIIRAYENAWDACDKAAAALLNLRGVLLDADYKH